MSGFVKDVDVSRGGYSRKKGISTKLGFDSALFCPLRMLGEV